MAIHNYNVVLKLKQLSSLAFSVITVLSNVMLLITQSHLPVYHKSGLLLNASICVQCSYTPHPSLLLKRYILLLTYNYCNWPKAKVMAYSYSTSLLLLCWFVWCASMLHPCMTMHTNNTDYSYHIKAAELV